MFHRPVTHKEVFFRPNKDIEIETKTSDGHCYPPIPLSSDSDIVRLFTKRGAKSHKNKESVQFMCLQAAPRLRAYVTVRR